MGRQKAFDREEVLDRALATFLRRGYEATSVQDLVTATGINRFSLYESFGDKHGLFLAALDRYHAKRQASVIDLLSEPGQKLPLIRRYFTQIIDDGLRPDRPGCLMVNSTIELARTDPEVALRASRHFSRLEDLFTEALLTAQRQEEICLRREARSVARYLLNNSRGLRIIVQYAQDRAVVEDILRTVWAVFDDELSVGCVEFQNARSENRVAAAN